MELVAGIGAASARRSALAVLAVASIATLTLAIAAPAQAAPHWYGEGKLLAGPVVVLSQDHSGDLSFHFTPSGPVECIVRARETITNPPGGAAGIGEVTQFKTKRCEEETALGPCSGEYHFNPVGLPWHSH